MNIICLWLEFIYKGLGYGICLNILLDNEYYDVIVFMIGVMENGYYCDYCDVGYSYIEEYWIVCFYWCLFCLVDIFCILDGI